MLFRFMNRRFMPRSLVLFALGFTVCFFVSGANAAAKVCKKGKPCGNSCISMNDVCHKDAGSATAGAPANSPAESAPAATSAATTTPAAAPAAKTDTAVPSEPKTWSKSDKPADAAAAPKAKNCKKGKPCGNTCIPADAVCHS